MGTVLQEKQQTPLNGIFPSKLTTQNPTAQMQRQAENETDIVGDKQSAKKYAELCKGSEMEQMAVAWEQGKEENGRWSQTNSDRERRRRRGRCDGRRDREGRRG